MALPNYLPLFLNTRPEPRRQSIIPIMGIKDQAALSLRSDAVRSLPDALFTRSQQRVLGILFGQPERSFHVNEIIELANVGRGAVSRELSRLHASRIASDTRNGRRKLYQANRESAVFPALCSLVRKTLGFAHPIREALEPIRDKIDLAFIYGSVAKGTDTATSDIDLLAVSDHLRSFELNVPFSPQCMSWGGKLKSTITPGKNFPRETGPATASSGVS